MSENLPIHKKRRGVARASITKLSNKITELEAQTSNPDALTIAESLVIKLKELNTEFRTHHLAIVDLTDDDEELSSEQGALDHHDDKMIEVGARLQRLISAITSSSRIDPKRATLKRLLHLKEKLRSIGESVSTATEDVDGFCKLHQHEEQLLELKIDLRDIRTTILGLDLEDTDPLTEEQSSVESAIFECSLAIKKQLHSNREEDGSPTTSSTNSSGVRLPKLEVPTFDGDVLNWKNFWQQFQISVHDRSNLTNTEKLVYLQNSLKGGTARHTIEGLTKSGEHYDEAIECLKTRYDRPRIIHQIHVKRILDAPNLKEGNGKELRALHDTVVQHLRALKTIGHETPSSFITSLLELKLDSTTMFEWQQHSQKHTDVPNHQELLDFINLRAQASEATSSEKKTPRSTLPNYHTNKPSKGSSSAYKQVSSFTASTQPTERNCPACKSTNHPLYTCNDFRLLSHDNKLALLKTNDYCINCLRPGHFIKNCKSLHHCKRCQKPHHTLLHLEENRPPFIDPVTTTSHHVSVGIESNMLLMTCQVLVETPQGTVKARALLDSASSASFVSERFAQSLGLQRFSQNAKIRGIANLTSSTQAYPVTKFEIRSSLSLGHKHKVTAVVVPRVTCDLPVRTIPFHKEWKHLKGLQLANPDFGKPGRIDILLGVEIFVNVVYQGRRKGPQGSPTALETEFGWVLAGNTKVDAPHCITTHHVSLLSGDDLLRQFWEVEEKSVHDMYNMTPEERTVMNQFQSKHTRTPKGRFIVPLPKKLTCNQLGESRSQAVRRFLSFERSLHAKGQFKDFKEVMDEYFEKNHAEEVPDVDLEKTPHQVFYLPIHAVRKETSTTTKIRAVFDVSAKSSSGISLNDTLMVGPTVHPTLVDVLMRFRTYRIALTTDVSRMYRAVLLTESDKDLHRFVWRSNPNSKLKDYRMTRITFGVSASSFIANMCVKQNALDFAVDYPKAARETTKSFYVDDGLTGADSVSETVELQNELQTLFSKGGFLLRKWNSSDPTVLHQIKPELRDTQSTISFTDPEVNYTKALGIEWDSIQDKFRLAVADLPPMKAVTKRALISDIAKTFDALGWFSPVIVKAKILLQSLWAEKLDWDDLVPESVLSEWKKWRIDLNVLTSHHISRCYYPKDIKVTSTQLHGFSDASERAYSGVVYIRIEDPTGDAYTSLVISKTRVAPIKRQTIPRLELCEALLLSQLLHHCKEVLNVPMEDVYAWTDATIVLNWIQGNPRRFKTYVGNRVSQIMDLVPPEHWRHVSGAENPADCASRGLFPSDILAHHLWWNGPDWLKGNPNQWPSQFIPEIDSHSEDLELCSFVSCTTIDIEPLISLDKFSNFSSYKRIIAWVIRFSNNCLSRKRKIDHETGPLTIQELDRSSNYWISVMQGTYFRREIELLKRELELPLNSKLLSLSPLLDDYGILRVGGRQQNAKFSYNCKHPVIIHGKHPLTKLLIRSEHLRLLHAGPLLLFASLSRLHHIIGGQKVVRSITRSCIICRRRSSRPSPQMMGQLPIERVTPDAIFSKTGVDYAGPVYIKQGYTRKPVVLKAYVCVFVSLSVKAVHLELVSDLTSESFIACLRRFISRRGKPTLIWSDHGTNFVGAKRVLQELFEFLQKNTTTQVISNFCSSQGIKWDFIPERTPHFGGLWEAAVKSLKTHLFRIVGDTKLTFEELNTVLTQIESCLNSRPLGIIPNNDEDGIEVLTPGHFLIGRPIEALPDHQSSYQPMSILRRWYLCESLVRHFWNRWSSEYLISLRKYSKWRQPARNLQVGDIVVLREDEMFPTCWPLAKIVETHKGKDGLVRIVKLKTKGGTYTRPVTKIALLLPCEQ